MPPVRLVRRELPSLDSMHLAIEDAGGLYVVPAAAQPEETRAYLRSLGIRAVELEYGCDLECVRDVPLEYLIASSADSVDALATLSGLRGLHVGSWSGSMPFDALPRLEWFGTTEAQPGQLDPLLAKARPALHHLAVGQYRFPDTTPLSLLAGLTHLAIGDSRRFASLAGLEQLPGTVYLSVYRCPALDSLFEVTRAPRLRHVEVESCNRITDLSPLGRLKRLRSVRIEARTPPDVAPLAGHPSLEYLWMVSARRPAPGVIEELLDSPRLRLIVTGRSCWLRSEGEWERVPDIYAMDERQGVLHERLMSQWNAVSAW